VNLLVLAAGYATRLYPETLERPKALLEVGGRAILARILDRTAALGSLERICVVSNHRFAAQLEEFARRHPAPVPIDVLDDGTMRAEERLGAIGDLALALRERSLDDRPLLVIAGDNLIEFELAPHAARFEALRRPLLLVRVLEPGAAGGSAYNEVELAPDGRVVRFREKPERRSSPLAAIALYFFPPGLRASVERYLAEGGTPDAPGHLIAWLVERTPVFASRIEGGWLDVGSRETLARARASVQD
jgi:glucose-1-phosphate thymidylyltransferase